MNVYHTGFSRFVDNIVNLIDELPQNWKDFLNKDWEELETRGVIWNLLIYSFGFLALGSKWGWFGVIVAVLTVVGIQWLRLEVVKTDHLINTQEEYRGSFPWFIFSKKEVLWGFGLIFLFWL